MPTDREDLLNDMTGNAPDTESLENNTPPVDETPPVDAPAPDAEQQKANEPAVDPHKESKAFLDSITEPDPNAKPRDADGKFAVKTDKPADEPKPDAAKPDAAAKTPEQEAEALIQEMGVKSERGQERIKQVFAKAKEAESKATQLESDITEFREMVTSTGMTPAEFAETLEFGRLLKSGDDKSLRTALQMVDQQRELICKQLGIEAPGVDPLADFPDLKQDIENLSMSKERALEIAKFRRQDQSRQQARQAQQTSQQEQQAYQQTLTQAAQTAEAYFKTRESEVDYPAKMAQIHAKFKDPAFVQEFVITYEPKQWFGIFKMMYDSIVVPAAPRQTQHQPARASQMMSGKPAANATAPLQDRLANHIDSLGI